MVTSRNVKVHDVHYPSAIFVGQKREKVVDVDIGLRMPSSSAIGCKRRASKKRGIKLYRFPMDAERRHLWTRALKRESWEPNKYSRICGAHFISGKYSVFVHSHKAAYRVEHVLTKVTFINYRKTSET